MINTTNIISTINNIIHALANSDYFTLLSGIASIGSILALGSIMHKFKKPNKSIANTPEASNIINYLIKETKKSVDAWSMTTLVSEEDCPELYGKIIPNSSFSGVFGNRDEEMIFCIVKTHNAIWLYGAIGLGHSTFRLITTNNNHPILENLYNLVSGTNELSNDDFLKEFIKRIS